MKDGRGPKPQSITERFWAKVEKLGNGDCWKWLAYKTTDGYGRMRINETFNGAHRVSWAIHFGAIPTTMHVLHRCDNPACVNPAHLFLGSNHDNVKDKIQKGRQARGAILSAVMRGEGNGFSKLTETQVIAIRRSKDPESVIAQQYGVTRSNVNYIKLRKSWAHLP